jgi:hypothetical protein
LISFVFLSISICHFQSNCYFHLGPWFPLRKMLRRKNLNFVKFDWPTQIFLPEKNWIWKFSVRGSFYTVMGLYTIMVMFVLCR